MFLSHSTLLRSMALVATVALSANCSGGASSGSNSSGGSVQLATIDDLPTATGPVESSASANISALNKGVVRAATTGMSLGEVDEDFFSDDSSMAACEMFNMTKDSIKSAAQGDLILCFVQQIFAAAAESGLTDGDGNAIDIYDGNPHVFALDFSGFSMGEDDEGGEAGPDHVKMTITKSGGVITGFEMQACSDGSQNEYLHQTISGNSFSMVSKHFNDEEEFTGSGHTTVTGTLNDEGDFEGTKEIVQAFEGEGSFGSQFGVVRFEQGADSATMTGYMSGTFNDPEHDSSGTFTNQIVGSMELLDANTDGEEYDIGLLALGDGAVHGAWTGSSAFGDWSHEDSEGWDGDTGLVDDEIADAYLNEVENADLPEEDQPTIAFDGDEIYDCGDEPEATLVMSVLQPDISACSPLQVSHQWINCWEVIQQ